MLAERHPGNQDRVVADFDHLINWVSHSVRNELSVDPLESTLQNQDVPKGIMGLCFDLQAQIVAEILEIVFWDDTGVSRYRASLSVQITFGG